MFAHLLYSIWLIYRTLSDATTPCQSGSGSNGNEGVLHIRPNLQGWSLIIRLFCVISRTNIRERSYPFCRDVISVSCSHRQLGWTDLVSHPAWMEGWVYIYHQISTLTIIQMNSSWNFYFLHYRIPFLT